MLNNSRIVKLIAIIALSSMLLSCASVYRRDAYTGDTELSAQTIGGFTGLATGLAVGGLLIAATNPALGSINTLILTGGSGILLGNFVGYFFDKHEAEVRNKLLATGVQVEKQDDGSLILDMPTPLFRLGSAEIQPMYESTLDSVATILKKYDNTVAIILGYTDDVGSLAENEKLSQQRADVVANYLHQQGVPNNQLYPVGSGEATPPFWESKQDARKRSRRVTIGLAHT